jgi:hypothetical protein
MEISHGLSESKKARHGQFYDGFVESKHVTKAKARFSASALAGVVLLGAGTLVACGSPSSGSSSAEQAASCDFDKVKEVLGLLKEYDAPSPEVKERLCAKAEPLIAEEEASQEALQNPADPKPAPEPSPLYYEEAIYGQEEANEGPPSDFVYENLWRGVVGKDNVAVFAGAEKDDPAHAVILLQIGDPLTGLHQDEVIDAPLPGPIRVVSADNPDVTVVSERSGEQAVFDSEKRAWE